jgi:hypothetical protein
MLWMNSVTRASLAPGYCRVSSRGSGRKGLIRPLSSPIFPYLPLSSPIFPYLPLSSPIYSYGKVRSRGRA